MGKNILLENEYESLLEEKHRIEKEMKSLFLDTSWNDLFSSEWVNRTIFFTTQNSILSSIDDVLKNHTIILNETILNNTENICKIWKQVELEYDSWEIKIVNICGKKPIKAKQWEYNISYESPLAKAIIWKEIWDDFELEINWKKIFWEIISIKNMVV